MFYTRYIQSNPHWQFDAAYYDAASGLLADKRPGYQQMLRDCREGKIDFSIVKSLSRFGLDTLETIRQIRALKEMGIGIYIEMGDINI